MSADRQRPDRFMTTRLGNPARLGTMLQRTRTGWKTRLISMFLVLSPLSLLAVSCGETGTESPASVPATSAVGTEPSVATTIAPDALPEATLPPASSTSEVETVPSQVEASSTTAAGVSVEDDSHLDRLDPLVRQVTASWPTDWRMSSINIGELLLGIQVIDPRDVIPPIDDPVFESIAAASEWLEDRVPGVVVLVGGEKRFYPLGILHRHEIVNDEIGGVPVAVTYCPLCNTALAFDRRVEGEVLRFGVSGLLRNSDLVMWDNRTVSLWQQVTGEAIVGSATGTVLIPLPTAIVSFGEFAESYPAGVSLARESGAGIPYISNPYVGYTSRAVPYPFYTGEIDPRYRALDRVVGVAEGGGATAYPFPLLSKVGVVNDAVGGVPVAVFWGGDTADALDTGRVSEGRTVGTGIAYLRTVAGSELTFTKEGDLFKDSKTSSEWTLLGEAISGPLAGNRLELAIHRNEFWFAWGAFFPDGVVYEG